jgi:N-acetylglucosaminyl-diphospho-decaprenol L-rhamnosyltransferase
MATPLQARSSNPGRFVAGTVEPLEGIDRQTMRIGAIVVHYRSWPRAEPNLRALLSGTRTPDRVLVVDNRSDDGSTDAIRTAFPSVEVLEAAANRGAAAGMNLGAERLLGGGTHAVLFLTADCLLDAAALAHLEARLEVATSVGAVGPLLGRASAPEEVFSAGGFVDRRTWDPGHLRDPRLVGEWTGVGPRSCEWLDGACVLVRVGALRQAGPLDERYFHYFDDVDLHLRLRSLGWGVECVPAAVAWQEPGRYRPDLWVRNRLRFLARHAPRSVLVREIARQANCAFRDVTKGDLHQAGGRARGAAHFVMGRWGPVVHP